MLDQLILLVKEHAGEAILNNPAIPNEKNEAAISATANSIFDVLKGQLAGGQPAAVTSLFKDNNTADHALIGKISGLVQQQLSAKFNLSSVQTTQIVQQLIPVVMQKLVQKTNDPQDNSFSMDDMLASFGSKKPEDVINSVKGFFGQ